MEAGGSKGQDYPQVQVQVQPQLNEICLYNNKAIYDFFKNTCQVGMNPGKTLSTSSQLVLKKIKYKS